MSGKRFTSPGLHRSRGGETTPSGKRTGTLMLRGRSAAAAAAAAAAAQHNVHGVPQSGYRPVSPEATVRRSGSSSMDTGTSRAVSASSVQGMLTDLVQLSQGIAAYLENDPAGLAANGHISPGQTRRGGPSEREAATLKAQEIERIINRVQSHFATKIDALERENAALRKQHQQLGWPSQHGGAAAALPPTGSGGVSVRQGLAAQGDALDELDRAWAAAGDSGHDVVQLRRVLLAEKRQRLLVEEQTQSLSEQHAKVVSTLERRLKKQEEQLQDLINAFDKNGPRGRSTSPGSQAALGAPMTPRRLLRQQLAQHQQTQLDLRQYRAQLGAPATDDDSDGDADMTEETQLPGPRKLTRAAESEDLMATLDSIRRSNPAASTATPGAPLLTVVAKQDAGIAEPISSSSSASLGAANSNNGMPPARRETGDTVDDIGAYLDSITRELEDLGGDDEFLS